MPAYQLRPDLVGISHGIVWSYLLVADEDVVAIDSGFFGGARRVRRWFQSNNRPLSQLRAIVQTHGHLDHVGGTHALQKWTNADVFLHPADHPIARGEFPYQGWTRVCGISEALGRIVTWYRPPVKLKDLSEGQVLPFWGGLQVIGLPGHTPGHVGLYAPKRRVLFIGDSILFRSKRIYFPARVLNVNHPQVRETLDRLVDLDVEWVYPMHHFGLDRNLFPDIRQYAEKRRKRSTETV